MSETFSILLPHVVLAVAGALFLLAGTFSINRRLFGPAAIGVLALVGWLLYGSSLVLAEGGAIAVRSGAITQGFQYCCLALGALIILQSLSLQQEANSPTGEFYGLLLLLLDGLLLVSVANDLIMLFLSLELISIPTYVLLYLGRKDQRSQEAAVKYFLLSIFSAAMLLYGLAFIYGLTGSTQFDAIQNVLTETYAPRDPDVLVPNPSILGVIALVLIFAGISFKLAAVPFHFYAPDVYEGTSAFNAGILAVVPKAAGIIALFRLVGHVTVGFEGTGQQLALILAGVTMTGGNCLALLQTNVRRMLAYSSVAHAGYMLIGFAVGFWEQSQLHSGLSENAGSLGLPGGMQASLLYLLAYSVASVGLFGALIYLGRPGRQIEHIDDLTGLAKSQPIVAIAMALFLFSMAGIPPLPGFWGKFSVFASALSVKQAVGEFGFQLHPAFAVLAVVGVINAAIGGVYYLRLIALIFLHEPLGAPRPTGGRSAYAATLIAAVGVILLGLIPGPVFHFLQNSAGTVNETATASVEQP
ncbi:MAG: NADH-quinone oxidoreductase subunit N [Planctomycetota bacterium]|nr:NADH-quinone oxidoreductase subunit N [Planctomycetota bacterium]